MMLDFSSSRAVGLDHLLEAARLVLHQHVRQQQRERLASDQLPRTPDGMAEAERRLLAGEACGPGRRQIVGQRLQLGGLLAFFQRCFELELLVEMVLDHALVAAGDEDEMLDAGLPRLVDDVLDQRPVHDRQHFLGHGLGGGQESGAKSCHRENRFANRFHVGRIMRDRRGSGHGKVGFSPRGRLGECFNRSPR